MGLCSRSLPKTHQRGARSPDHEREGSIEREKDSVSECGGGEYKDIKRLVREDEEGENNANTSHHSHTSIGRLGLIDGLMRWNWRWQQLKVSLGRRRWRRCFVW